MASIKKFFSSWHFKIVIMIFVLILSYIVYVKYDEDKTAKKIAREKEILAKNKLDSLNNLKNQSYTKSLHESLFWYLSVDLKWQNNSLYYIDHIGNDYAELFNKKRKTSNSYIIIKLKDADGFTLHSEKFYTNEYVKNPDYAVEIYGRTIEPTVPYYFSAEGKIEMDLDTFLKIKSVEHISNFLFN